MSAAEDAVSIVTKPERYSYNTVKENKVETEREDQIHCWQIRNRLFICSHKTSPEKTEAATPQHFLKTFLNKQYTVL